MGLSLLLFALLGAGDVWAEDAANANCPKYADSKTYCAAYTDTYKPADRSSNVFQMVYQGRSKLVGDLLNMYTSFSTTETHAIARVKVYAECSIHLLCRQNEDQRKGAVDALRVKLTLLEKLLAQSPRLDAEERGFYVNEAGSLAETAASLRREAKDPEAHEVADLLTRLQVQLTALPIAGR